MSRIRLIRSLAIAVITGGLITLFILLLVKLAPDPPVGDIDYAREMLARAGASKAGTYSKKLFSEASAAFDSAMKIWKSENRKFIYFRNYDEVRNFALIAAKKAKQAAESSVTNSTSLQVKLKEKIDTLRKTEESLDQIFGRYPLQAEIRSRISKGKMLLKEGTVAYGKGQYLSANRKITDAEYLLISVFENAKGELRNYFQSYQVWKNYVQAAITESKKNNSYSVIVDKFSRKCYLYLGGVKKYEFDAELGRNWAGTKHRAGDKATPEGKYKIVRKYQGRETPYHKALALDYPNAEDKERFRQEVVKGILPASSRIGGGIEIHGGGGKGVDWTEGCIALTDTEIDIVYNLLKVGTPVTIVGSVKPLDEILLN
jgi:L,D-peptidoglycan transpeptidase YkuD (ErfK/YbiS/YcfS/YnhG family)